MSLAGWLLNVVYLCLLAVASPLLVYRSLVYGKYRDGWPEKLLGRVPRRESRGRCVWLHAVSVGEVLLLRTVIDELRRAHRELEVWISTTTHTGHAVAAEQFPDCRVVYFPLDFTWSVRAALQRVRPDVVGLAELELWPNFIRAAAKEGIPLVLINGRISEGSFRGYRRIRFLMRPTLQRFSVLAVQTEEYRERLIQLGASGRRTVVTGSIKFDGCRGAAGTPGDASVRLEVGIAPGERVFVAGSTHAPEEEIVLDCYGRLREEFGGLRLVIAPRHRERFDEVAAIIARRGLSMVRRSHPAAGELAAVPGDCPVILWDTLGELQLGWGLADVAFVGGSLSQRGGQNVLEPCSMGAAVVTGPNTSNFRETVDLLVEGDAIRIVECADGMLQSVRRLLIQPEEAAGMVSRAQEVVRLHQGATLRTVELLLDVMRGEAFPAGVRAAA